MKKNHSCIQWQQKKGVINCICPIEVDMWCTAKKRSYVRAQDKDCTVSRSDALPLWTTHDLCMGRKILVWEACECFCIDSYVNQARDVCDPIHFWEAFTLSTLWERGSCRFRSCEYSSYFASFNCVIITRVYSVYRYFVIQVSILFKQLTNAWETEIHQCVLSTGCPLDSPIYLM